jgi:anaerobic selenocysteine-containing dehydrogenase
VSAAKSVPWHSDVPKSTVSGSRRKIVEPPGLAREDWAIIVDLAQRPGRRPTS